MITRASTVNGVPRDEIPWDKVRPHLERIERHDKDGMTADEYAAEINNCSLQVWSLNNFEGIALTRVTRDAVRLEWAVGRNRQAWERDLDAVLRVWRDRLGKKRILVHARKGWVKLAGELGYNEIQRVYEAE